MNHILYGNNYYHNHIETSSMGNQDKHIEKIGNVNSNNNNTSNVVIVSIQVKGYFTSLLVSCFEVV